MQYTYYTARKGKGWGRHIGYIKAGRVPNILRNRLLMNFSRITICAGDYMTTTRIKDYVS